jgi:hypothetical protein
MIAGKQSREADSMSDERTESRKRGGWLWWILMAIALVIAYPLSLGPVAWLDDRGYLSEPMLQVLTTFYYPIAVIQVTVPAADAMLDWYLSLFLE